MGDSYFKTRTVKIAGREFTIAFTLKAMIEMQNDIADFDLEDINHIVTKPEMLVSVLYILAKSGAALEGKTLDVDKEWFSVHIPPNIKKLFSLQLSVIEACVDGMTMETEEEEDREREVDVILQEIQKKSQRTDLPGGKSQPGD